MIDQLAESYHSTSPYTYVMNNPVMMTDPDGRYAAPSFGYRTKEDRMMMANTFGSDRYLPQDLEMMLNPGSRGGGSSFFTQNISPSINEILGNDKYGPGNYLVFKNDGKNVTWWSPDYFSNADGTRFVEGNDIVVSIQGMIGNTMSLEKYLSKYGSKLYNKATDHIDSFSNWIQNHPREISGLAGVIQGASDIAAKGLKNWNAPSNITKSKVFAETISTKLPTSVNFLGKASTALKWGGTAVGIVGLTNTAYQYSQGNISGTRAVVDVVMGVAGFFPATAWVSVGYFAGMALYETYYNDGKAAF